MELKEAIRKRRSIRLFDKTKKVTDAQLRELFELTSLSPSAYNLQPWKFIVVRDEKRKGVLRACGNNQAQVEDASAVIIVLAKLNPSEDVDEIISDRDKKGYFPSSEIKQNYIKIMKEIDTNEEIKAWAIKNAYLASATLMLAATDMGLATCPIEGFNPDCVIKNFRIPSNYFPTLLITLGYQLPDAKIPERLARKTFEKTVDFEQFRKKQA
ncbi:malonic semialdehyde reductase RutE [Candidatus Gugararchaeum adminiculabundum]|nr:malonic semialdehyde reductase RutE [Candidatus Gugararchaeum adminiculabundum]